MSIHLIFSYWIFILFLIYYSFHNQYDIGFMNPSLLLVFAIGHQFLTFLYYVYKKLPVVTLVVHFLVLLLFKALPLYLLRNSDHKNNVLFSLTFFIVYLAYLDYIGTNFNDVYHRINEYMINGTDDPFFKFFSFLK